jgi:hypothetical protein
MTQEDRMMALTISARVGKDARVLFPYAERSSPSGQRSGAKLLPGIPVNHAGLRES